MPRALTPGLATVLVGDDPASAVYVRMKREDCAQVGIESFHHEPGGDVSREDLAALIAELNADPRVHGILLQLPLPDHLDDDEMTALIDPAKDVDGLTPTNAGLLMHGRDALVACTPVGVMELLRAPGRRAAGARAVVVGRSQLVGKPLAQLLMAANATVTHCHSRTRDLADDCRRADVLVAAVGRPRPDHRRHGEGGRRGDRRGHQPHRRRQADGRRRLRRRQPGGGRDHAGARRRRADDDRDAAGEHAEGRAAAGVA